ncbi:MAG: efflux transporter outer membrane subunit, partial [Planctomycetota bacterium]
MKRAALAAATLFASSLAGCALVPDWERPETKSPASLAPAQGEGVTAITSDEPWERWWEVFREPQLEQLVKDAREQNQQLRAAFARVQAVRALVSQQRAPLFPSASLNGDYRYQRASRGTIAFSVSRDTKPFKPTDYMLGTADLAWELDIFGRVRRGLESADNELVATEEDRRGLEVSLIADVADAYFDLGEAEASLELAREIVATRERSLGLVKDRLAAGVAQELDLRRAESELESARAQVPAARRRHALAEHRLAILTGRTPDVSFHGKPPAAFALPPSVPVGLPASLLERRPDVRAAERRAAAQNALVGQAIANFF